MRRPSACLSIHPREGCFSPAIARGWPSRPPAWRNPASRRADGRDGQPLAAGPRAFRGSGREVDAPGIGRLAGAARKPPFFRLPPAEAPRGSGASRGLAATDISKTCGTWSINSSGSNSPRASGPSVADSGSAELFSDRILPTNCWRVGTAARLSYGRRLTFPPVIGLRFTVRATSTAAASVDARVSDPSCIRGGSP